MSVPAWKKAIIERRKKQEDDQKKKQAEEEAYLATMPPWKRALFQKREREKREQEEREKSASAESCERSNSFQQRQKQLAQERERRNTSSTNRSWGRKVTPPSYDSASDNEPPSPSSPSYGTSRQFFPSTSAHTQPPYEARGAGRRSSVTTLPGLDTPIAEKVAKAPLPESTWQSRQRSFSEAASTSQKVVSSVRKFDEVKPKVSEIPAWKKALLQRRKEKAGHGQRDTPSAPKETSEVAVSSLPVERKESPSEEVDVDKVNHAHSEPVSVLAIQREPSPQEHTRVEPPLQLQRRRSPIEQATEDFSRRSTPSPPVETTHTPVDLQHTAHVPSRTKNESKSLAFGRKPSPVETVALKRSESPIDTRDKASSWKSHEKTPPVSSAVKTQPPKNAVSDNQKLVPKRTAPIAPASTAKTQPGQNAATQQRERANLSKPQQRPAPEIVNRGNPEQTVQQNEVIRTEGVAHRAPVYKEVDEWANVAEDDPKFRSLPTWKQALIKRRRADIAKRKGLTTSVDDVPLTNGPIQAGDGAADVPLWKKQMMQKKAEGNLSGQMSTHEKKHLTTGRESPASSGATVKALLGQFNTRPTSSPAVTIAQPPRSPSPSSAPPSHPEPPTTSSRPPYSSAGVPQPSSSTTHTTRKSFTWTPAEDTMPGDELSDDSSGEDDDDTEHITNIDDVSSLEEEEEDEKEGGESEVVVLLKPPQPAVTHDMTESRVRKTSSILVGSGRPKKRVRSMHMYIICMHVYM